MLSQTIFAVNQTGSDVKLLLNKRTCQRHCWFNAQDLGLSEGLYTSFDAKANDGNAGSFNLYIDFD